MKIELLPSYDTDIFVNSFENIKGIQLYEFTKMDKCIYIFHTVQQVYFTLVIVSCFIMYNEICKSVAVFRYFKNRKQSIAYHEQWRH